MSDDQQNGDIEEALTATNGKLHQTDKVMIETYRYLHDKAKTWINNKMQDMYLSKEIQYIITIPSIWNDNAKLKVREWAIEAGLVDKDIDSQCRIVYEPNCASLALQYDNDNEFKDGDKYILIDAGGGTVDIVCHEIIGDKHVNEISKPSGGPWGSCFIDQQFIKLLETLFSKEWMDEYKQKEPSGYVEIIHNFQDPKASFYIDLDKDTHNVELPLSYIQFN